MIKQFGLQNTNCEICVFSNDVWISEMQGMKHVRYVCNYEN